MTDTIPFAATVMLQVGCEDESAAPGGNQPNANQADSDPDGSGSGKTMPTDGAQPGVSNNPEAANAGSADNAAPPVMADTQPPAEIVEVKLAERDAATVLVGQGDLFPESQASLGTAATVFLFWTPDDEYSVQWVQDLLLDEVSQLPGVNVTLVSVGAQTQAAQAKLTELAPTLPADITVLADTDRSLFDKVANGTTPRLYLVDSQGKVLWFCIDHSVASYEEFQSALRVVQQSMKDAG